MDLRIEIKDENDKVRYRGTVYQDGSDSEGLDRIIFWLELLGAQDTIDWEHWKNTPGV